MDRLVRLFSGGTVKENGEFARMRQEVARIWLHYMICGREVVVDLRVQH